jgi:penicillin amidase
MTAESRAEILYDRGGVPHVRADSQLGVYFGQGYATAADRLWQLDLFRRTATGRLAECFGGRALGGDRFQRSLAIEFLVARMPDQLAPDARARIDAYCEGVNAWVESHPLPPEFDILSIAFEPWTVLDVLRCGVLRSIVNASWRADLVVLALVGRAGVERARDLLAQYDMPDGGPETLAGTECDEALLADCLDLVSSSEQAMSLVGLEHIDTGSNTWAVDGALTRSRRPLLANDAHMGFVAPNQNFLVHLTAPGLDVRGVTLPGMPGVLLGHNERIAWGSTALMADAQDVFVEEIDASGERYRFQGEWRAMRAWDEEIRVRDGKPVRVRVRLTHHGPLVRARGGWALALRWERLDTPPGDPTFHALNVARNWKEFRAALRSYSLPPTDFTYADIDGNIGAQSAGCVPRRAAGDGVLPAPGRDGRYEWLGYVPFEELPSVFRPAEHFVVRANQNHDGGRSGHLLSRRWHPPYRARRIRTLLQERQDHDVDTFARIQHDRLSAHNSFVARRVLAATEGLESGDAVWRAARRLLDTWDGRLSPDSAAASIVKECAALIKTAILTPVLGKSLMLSYQRFWPASNLAIEGMLEREDARWLPSGTADFRALYRAALADAVTNLCRAFQTDDVGRWRWGLTNRVHFAHPLESVPFFGERFRHPDVEVGGDGECVFSARSVGDYISAQQTTMLDREAGRGAVFGAATRLVWNVGDWDDSSMLLNLGQSADPRSPHYRDHLEPWRTGGVLRLPFTREGVDAGCVRRVVIAAPAVASNQMPAPEPVK